LPGAARRESSLSGMLYSLVRNCEQYISKRFSFPCDLIRGHTVCALTRASVALPEGETGSNGGKSSNDGDGLGERCARNCALHLRGCLAMGDLGLLAATRQKLSYFLLILTSASSAIRRALITDASSRQRAARSAMPMNWA